MCGEHLVDKVHNAPSTGSSPRVRGTQKPATRRVGYTGIIPACAGNTFLINIGDAYTRDHPRVCGEHRLIELFTKALTGSSPRVRGTHNIMAGKKTTTGIIPACAGNTVSKLSYGLAARDHPRVCGEHKVHERLRRCTPGSSPRVRGTRQVLQEVRWQVGIIPACAGNTLKNPSSKYHNIQEIATFQ